MYKYQNDLEKEFAESLIALCIRYNVRIESYTVDETFTHISFWNKDESPETQIYLEQDSLAEIIGEIE